MVAAAPIDESSYTVKPVPQVDADASRAEILALVQREKESREIIGTILKTDPNNVRALETMGGIELRAGQPYPQGRLGADHRVPAAGLVQAREQ